MPSELQFLRIIFFLLYLMKFGKYILLDTGLDESWLLAYLQWLLVYRVILSFQSLTLWSKLPLEHRRTFVYLY